MVIIMNGLNDLIASAIEAQVPLEPADVRKLISKPKVRDMGDVAFPCHPLAKTYKKPPKFIAEELAETISAKLKGSGVAEVTANNGYVNFKFDDRAVYDHVLGAVLSMRENYGSNTLGNDRLVVIDYSAPNLGKPMHVGHIRSTIIGDSTKRILEFTGHRTYGINYLGDIGLHIGKIAAAYMHWGDAESLNRDPEKEMFELYVRFGKEAEANPSLDAEAKNALEEIEAGNPEYVELWDKIRVWSQAAFDRVYELLDVEFDETTGQSRFSDKGKAIVQKALENKLARYKKDGGEEEKVAMEEGEGNGGVVIPLEEYGLRDKIILRSDGTAIYSTQDLGAAVSRYEEHKFDRMIYVVATEQSLYFQQLFKIIELMGNDWHEKCHHLGFGLIHLAEGRMSTREGNIVLLEDVVLKSVDEAKKAIAEKHYTDEQREVIARQVGIGALKYSVLGVDPVKDITFSWENAMNLSGNSGPYIQYQHARANTLLKKAGANPDNLRYKTEEFTLQQERDLVAKIGDFPEIVQRAGEKLSPNIICNYLNELALQFSSYYSKVHVIGTPEQESRIAVVYAVKQTLENGLNLLGIKAPQEM